MRRMYDAATPPANPPAWEVVAGYIGGDTPHVWTLAEWNSQPARWRLPIWTRSNPAGASEGTSEGQAAVAKVKALGMPAGCAIALDLETAVAAAYVTAFDAAVVAGGYKTIEYGSASYVFQNPKTSDGYWDALWNQTAQLSSGADATQFAGDTQLGEPWDASLVSDSLVLWDTKPTQPTSVPAVSSALKGYNNMHVDLQLNKLVTFTNPAAVFGGTTHMLFASDFGDATVRVAYFSFHTGNWSVYDYDVSRTGGAVNLSLPGDTNKVSVMVTKLSADNAACSLDVLY